MSDFQQFNGVTHPIIRLADDWNNLLDHGLSNPVTYIIRMNGAVCEGIDGDTGKIYSSGTPATVIQAVLTHIDILGGGDVLLKNGIYTLTTGLIKSPRVNLDGEGVNTVLVMDAGVADYAITVTTNYNNWTYNSVIQNLSIVGTATAIGGIRLVDVFKQKVNNVVISDFSTGYGIRLTNDLHWTEGYVISNVYIAGCLIGIDFQYTGGGGTTSFSYGYIGPYWISVDVANGVGINIPVNCDFTRSELRGVCWLNGVTHKGVVIGGQCGDNIMDFEVETFDHGVGVEVQATAWLGSCRRFEPRFIGIFTTELSNVANQPIYSVHEQPLWVNDKIVIINHLAAGLGIWNSTTGVNFLNFNTVSGDLELTGGGYFTLYNTGFAAANIGFQVWCDGSGGHVFGHSLLPLGAVPGHAADASSGIGNAAYPWKTIYGVDYYGGAGAAQGITKDGANVIDIKDGDGTHYHHLTFTSGLLTNYVYDTNP